MEDTVTNRDFTNIFCPKYCHNRLYNSSAKRSKKSGKRIQRISPMAGNYYCSSNSTVYSISFLPLTVYFIAQPFVEKDSLHPGPFYLEFYRVACASLYFNVLSNFLIYSLSVTSFRRFLKTRFRLTAQFFFDTSSSQGNDYNIFHL